MDTLDQVITAREAAEMVSGPTLHARIKKIRRLCYEGKLIARQDPTGAWLILKNSMIESREKP